MAKVIQIKVKRKVASTGVVTYDVQFFVTENTVDAKLVGGMQIICEGKNLTTFNNGFTPIMSLPAGTYGVTALHPDYETTTVSFTLP